LAVAALDGGQFTGGRRRHRVHGVCVFECVPDDDDDEA
jgi:hypothetical protein